MAHPAAAIDLSSHYTRSKTRVCAFTHVFEKDLPAGKKLLTCSKCEETCYVDRESQKAHWPLHKHSCCSIRNDKTLKQVVSLPPYEQQTRDDILRMMQGLLLSPMQKKGRLLLYGFQALADKRFFSAFTSKADVLESIWTYIHAALARSWNHSEDTVSRIWAIPGWTNYFLSDDLFLSPMYRELKQAGIENPQNDKTISKSENNITASQTPLAEQFLSPWYCEILSVVLKVSALRVDMVHWSKQGEFRSNSLAAAVLKHAMKLWQCPYTIRSFLSPKTNCVDLGQVWRHGTATQCFAIMFYLTRKDMNERPAVFLQSLNEDELVPGMKAREIMEVILNGAQMILECYQRDGLNALVQSMFILPDEYSPLRVLHSGLCQQKYFTIQDRVKLLEALLSGEIFWKNKDDCDDDDVADAYLKSRLVLACVTYSSNIMLKMTFLRRNQVAETDIDPTRDITCMAPAAKTCGDQRSLMAANQNIC